MCRVLAYAGPPIPLEDLLFLSSSSLVKQTVAAQQLDMLNLAGFGFVGWDPASREPHEPWIYRSTMLPNFDPNLRVLARKLRVSTVLAHVRGVPLTADAGVGSHNLHPFRYPGYAWSMAHNGAIEGFAEIRHALHTHTRPEVARRIGGTTDSEAIYALTMSQLRDPQRADTQELSDAVLRSLRVLRQVRAAHGLDTTSSVNLCFTNGTDVVALRFVFDFGRYPIGEPQSLKSGAFDYLSLWYTVGERFEQVGGDWRIAGGADSTDTVLVASEPLSLDTTGWVEVPEYTLLTARRVGSGMQIRMTNADA